MLWWMEFENARACFRAFVCPFPGGWESASRACSILFHHLTRKNKKQRSLQKLSNSWEIYLKRAVSPRKNALSSYQWYRPEKHTHLSSLGAEKAPWMCWANTSSVRLKRVECASEGWGFQDWRVVPSLCPPPRFFNSLFMMLEKHRAEKNCCGISGH